MFTKNQVWTSTGWYSSVLDWNLKQTLLGFESLTTKFSCNEWDPGKTNFSVFGCFMKGPKIINFICSNLMNQSYIFFKVRWNVSWCHHSPSSAVEIFEQLDKESRWSLIWGVWPLTFSFLGFSSQALNKILNSLVFFCKVKSPALLSIYVPSSIQILSKCSLVIEVKIWFSPEPSWP